MLETFLIGYICGAFFMGVCAYLIVNRLSKRFGRIEGMIQDIYDWTMPCSPSCSPSMGPEDNDNWDLDPLSLESEDEEEE